MLYKVATVEQFAEKSRVGDQQPTGVIDVSNESNSINHVHRLQAEKLVSLQLSSQQTADNLTKDLSELLIKYGNDSLDQLLPPTVLDKLKGRMKSTKRDKLAIEHQEATIKKGNMIENVSHREK